jgi:ribosomal protein L7/L12
MTEALRTLAGLSLGEAKSITDRVLEGGSVEVPCPSQSHAERLAARLDELGAVTELVTTGASPSAD